MSTLQSEQIVARLKALPALPTVVAELLASFGNEDVDIGRLAEQISHDQALTARLLRVANSSFYGLQSRISTINEAVVVLGFRAVRSMVLAVGVSGVFRADQCPGFDPQLYIRHCVGVGLTARALARVTGRNPELAFTGGILHDIGELVLATCFPRTVRQGAGLSGVCTIARRSLPSATFSVWIMPSSAACWPTPGVFPLRCIQPWLNIIHPQRPPPIRWPT